MEVSQSEHAEATTKRVPTGHSEKLLPRESGVALGPGSDRSGGRERFSSPSTLP